MPAPRHDRNSRFARCTRRTASAAAALSAWVVICWWFFSSADLGKRLSQLDNHVWVIPIQTGLLVLLWKYGFSSFHRSLRLCTRTLYYFHVEGWKIWTLDIVLRPVAILTTILLILVNFDMMLWQIPPEVEVSIPPVMSELGVPSELGGAQLREIACDVLHRAFKAFLLTLLASTLATLLDPPDQGGSNMFRLVPVRLRENTKAAPYSNKLELPNLVLFCHDEEIPMPQPQLGPDHIPVWEFEEPAMIDEYSWVTSTSAPPEHDPIEWRFEGAMRPNTHAAIQWHMIHTANIDWDTSIAPIERGVQCTRRFIAPSGLVPVSEKGLLASYYRALQNPRKYRDQFAIALLLRKLLFPLFIAIGLIPWLSVFGLEFASYVGMTSVTGVAVGAVVSLAKSEVIENMLAGTLMSAQGNFIQGDTVEILYDVGNSQKSVKGVVCNIGTAYLSLQDEDGKIVQVPNRRVLGSVLRTKTVPAHMNRLRRGDTLAYLSRPQ